MSRKYKFGEKDWAYFVSFATVNWIDVFTRVAYFDCIIESFDPSDWDKKFVIKFI